MISFLKLLSSLFERTDDDVIRKDVPPKVRETCTRTGQKMTQEPPAFERWHREQAQQIIVERVRQCAEKQDHACKQNKIISALLIRIKNPARRDYDPGRVIAACAFYQTGSPVFNGKA